MFLLNILMFIDSTFSRGAVKGKVCSWIYVTDPDTNSSLVRTKLDPKGEDLFW